MILDIYGYLNLKHVYTRKSPLHYWSVFSTQQMSTSQVTHPRS